jgi:isocitrate dehydrogenase
MITSKQDALVTALALAITAPNDEKAQECVKMADEFASQMDRKDVELAMKTVLDKLTESLEGTWNDK